MNSIKSNAAIKNHIFQDYFSAWKNNDVNH